ncbi:transmembrane emp24 domain-containing protein a [Anaeramoeba flamelloides]|uniref:Transmembrane emp24 domain-containing protein a n=1 Tax=Anaeramoeba flamelloides TaxID=1746091 RepID=A0AAV7YZ13_9EUKA|nr:transmembrane emp24 domain-containing protein a [Anaeramoeba flamelloides]KAJ6228413.1 transmembrane emp24 domain-containing protein a [Anaeramoeba flamelloides]
MIKASIFVSGILFLIFLLPIVSGFSFNVSPSKEQCFYENVKKDEFIQSQFQVVKGAKLDINFKITTASGRLIHYVDRKQEEKFVFVAQNTDVYKFCFDNSMSHINSKDISFDLKLGAHNTDTKLATQEDLTPLENKVLGLVDKISDVSLQQKYLKIREKVHRNTTESTNSRILWWSFFELFLLVCASFAQIWYVRRYFSKRRHV